MEVSWHDEAGVVVISLWQGGTCRSTFRMPVEDAPALISTLSSALGDALSGPHTAPPGSGTPRRPARGSTLLEALRSWGRRRRGVVVALHRATRDETEATPSR